jgi:hypothetical protein
VAAADEQRAEAEHRTRRAGTPASALHPGAVHSGSAPDTGTTGDSEDQVPDLAESDQECYSSFSGALKPCPLVQGWEAPDWSLIVVRLCGRLVAVALRGMTPSC